MLNIESLLNSIELQLEIKELRDVGLTEEEIEGYIEFYHDSWIVPNDTLLN